MNNKNIVKIIIAFIILVTITYCVKVILIEKYLPTTYVSINDLGLEYKEEDEELIKGLYGYGEDDKIGIKNGYGNIIFNPQFEEVGTVINGLVAVKVNELWGVVDYTGKKIIDEVYTYIRIFDNKIVVNDNGVDIVFDFEGKEILRTDKYSINNISEDVVRILSVDENKEGYMNLEGTIIAEAIYEQATVFESGVGAVLLEGYWKWIDSKGVEIARNMNVAPKECDINNYGIEQLKETINKYNSNIYNLNISLELENIYYSDGLIVGNDKDSKELVCYDAEGKEVYRLDNKYKNHGQYKNNMLIVKSEDGIVKYLDRLGKQIVEFSDNKYTIDYMRLKNNIITLLNPNVSKNANAGVINESGKTLVPLIYNEVSFIDEDARYIKATQDTFAYIEYIDIYYEGNKMNKEPIIDSDIEIVGSGVVKIKENNKEYYLNKYGMKF